MLKKFAAVGLLLMAAVCAGAAENKPEDVYAAHGMVSSAHELASKAGVEIMQKGGNAIDAAVATAMALNVVEFNASGIGGGGYMTIRFAKTGETVCLDYREQAPASATKDLFASDQAKKEKWSVEGGKAIGVPGWIKGMEYALKKYGTMTLAQVAVPAIRLAEEGFVIAPMQHGIISDYYTRIMKYNKPAAVAYFQDDLPIEAGKVMKQPELARTFKLVAAHGSDVFYKGEIGEAVCKAVNAAGGKMTMEDLDKYKLHVRVPAQGTYRGYKIFSMPPSSSGGTHIIELLNIMECFDVKKMGHNSPAFAHAFAEASKLIFADRIKFMSDPDFNKLPLKGLQSKEYARARAAEITKTPLKKAAPGDPWKYDDTVQKTSYLGGMGSERQSTSSFSVVDQQGNIVTSTNTINYFCGSGVMVPGYGFMLNNEMDDFSNNPASVNAPEPGKRPLSSMSPTIVLDPQGNAFMSIGSAGSARIITAISQIIMNVIDHGMTMDEAIEKRRIHCQTDLVMKVDYDPDKALVDSYQAMGYKVEAAAPGYNGTAQGILFDQKNKRMDGGADGRRLGVPIGF